MANRFWVGGTGNIDGADTTHWAATTGGAGGASYPGPTDSVFFDGNSGGGTVTVTVAPTWLNFDSTGYTGTYNGNSLFTTLQGTVCTIGASMTAAPSFAFSLNPVTASSTLTLTTNGKVISSFAVSAATTAAAALADALTVSNAFSHNSGGFITNSFSLTVQQYASSNSAVRSLALGTSTVTCTGSSVTAWNIGTGTNMTLSAASSTITLTGASSGFSSNVTSQVYGTLNFTGSGAQNLGNSTLTTCTNITRTGTAVKTDSLAVNGNITATGTATFSGNSSTNRIIVQSNIIGTARTITAATVSASNVDFMDITGAGAGSWNLSAITGGSGDAGGNSGITFTTSATQFWRNNGGNWSDSTHWSLTSGGGATGRVPLSQDNVRFDANSFSLTAQTVSADMPRLGTDIDWNGVTNSPTWTNTLSTNITMFGSMTYSSSMFRTGWLSSIIFGGRGTHTYTSAGISQPASIFNNFGGTYTFQDAYTTTGQLSQSAGTLNTNGVAVTCFNFVSTGSITRALTLGTSTVTLTATSAGGSFWNVAATGLTLSAATSTIVLSVASANTRSFTSTAGAQNYGTLTYTVAASTGRLAMSTSTGTSFATINVSGGVRELNFTSGTSTTVANWNVFGLTGAVVSVTASTPGSAATISKASGFVASDYVSVQDITGGATGATYYMGSRSTNVSGNTGLTFTDAPQRFWVGGTGSWDATTTTNWAVVSGGTGGLSTPTNSMDVYFDASSGGGTVTVAGGGAAVARNFSSAGSTQTFAGGGTINITGTGATSVVIGAGVTTVNVPYTLGPTTGVTMTLTTNGKQLSALNVNGVGTVSLLDATSMANALTLTQGTLLTNSFAVTCGSFVSSFSSTRTLTFGSSSVTITGAGVSWNTSTATALTITANTAAVTLSGAGVSWNGSSAANYQGMSVVFTGSGAASLTSGTYANVTRVGTAIKTDSMTLTGTYTITGTYTVTGNSAINRVLVQSNTLGTARSVTAANVSMSNVDFQDIIGAGAGNWNLSAITGGSGDAGGNTGITFTTGQINYWVGGTGNWSDVTHWASTSGGGGGTGRVPLPQGTARFDANSFTGASQTVTNDMPRLVKDMDWTGATNSPTWLNGSVTGAIYGSVTLIAAMTYTSGSSAAQLFGRGSHTITMAGLGWANSFSINGPGGTYTQQDAFRMGSASTSFTVAAGTWITNGFSLTAASIISSGGFTRGIDFGTSSVVLNGTGTVWSFTGVGGLNTVSAASANISITSTSVTNRTFASGGVSIGSLTYTAATAASLNLSISSFTVGTLNVSGSGKSLTMTAGITVTVTNWNVFGVAGSPVTLASFTPGTPANIVKAGGGEIGTDYLSISDIAASPGSTWYAGTHSVDGGGNTGWIFTDPPITANASLSLVATGAAQVPVTVTAALSLLAATATAQAPAAGTAAISLVAIDTSVVVARTGTAAISLVATATAKATTIGTAQVTLTAVNAGATAALAGSAVLTLTAARVVSVGARDVQVEFSVVYDKYVAGTPELYTMTTGTPSI